MSCDDRRGLRGHGGGRPDHHALDLRRPAHCQRPHLRRPGTHGDLAWTGGRRSPRTSSAWWTWAGRPRISRITWTPWPRPGSGRAAGADHRSGAGASARPVALAPWTSGTVPSSQRRRADCDRRRRRARPEDAERDAEGFARCEVIGFVLSGPDLPKVYVSGDNASSGPSPRCPANPGDQRGRLPPAPPASSEVQNRALSLDSIRAAAAAAILGSGVRPGPLQRLGSLQRGAMTWPAPSMTQAWPRGFASATVEPGRRSNLGPHRVRWFPAQVRTSRPGVPRHSCSPAPARPTARGGLRAVAARGWWGPGGQGPAGGIAPRPAAARPSPGHPPPPPAPPPSPPPSAKRSPDSLAQPTFPR